MARALVLSGGFPRDHDFSTTAPLCEAVSAAGIQCQVAADVDAGLASLSACSGPDLLVTNVLQWTMEAPAYAPYRSEYAFSPSASARAGLAAHLRRGGGVLALHTSVISFDDWPEWGDCLGARWEWGVSGHPPVGPLHVDVTMSSHPVVEGVVAFDVTDELYGRLALASIEVIACGRSGTDRQPVLWARRHGAARVVVDLLGHDGRSYEVAAHTSILTRAACWLVSGGP